VLEVLSTATMGTPAKRSHARRHRRPKAFSAAAFGTALFRGFGKKLPGSTALEDSSTSTSEMPPAAAPTERSSAPLRQQQSSSSEARRRRPRANPLAKVAQAALVIVILGSAAFAGLALFRGSWMVTPVLSGSMRPGLPVGGVAISQRVPVSSLADREVIVFRSPVNPSEQVVHRIVKLDHTGSGQVLINTQGDANMARDPWTLTIQGHSAYRVRWSIPLVGYAAVAFQNDRGFVLLGVGTVLIAMAGSEVFKERGLGRPHTKGPGLSRLAPEDLQAPGTRMTQR
jgi:signal peptidase I